MFDTQAKLVNLMKILTNTCYDVSFIRSCLKYFRDNCNNNDKLLKLYDFINVFNSKSEEGKEKYIKDINRDLLSKKEFPSMVYCDHKLFNIDFLDKMIDLNYIQVNSPPIKNKIKLSVHSVKRVKVDNSSSDDEETDSGIECVCID